MIVIKNQGGNEEIFWCYPIWKVWIFTKFLHIVWTVVFIVCRDMNDENIPNDIKGNIFSCNTCTSQCLKIIFVVEKTFFLIPYIFKAILYKELFNFGINSNLYVSKRVNNFWNFFPRYFLSKCVWKGKPDVSIMFLRGYIKILDDAL